MNRPIPQSRTQMPSYLMIRNGSALAYLVVTLGSCGTPDRTTVLADASERAAATGAPEAPTTPPVPATDTGRLVSTPPEVPARDPDQRFLRRLLDEHERLAAIVHERMMMRHDDHAMEPGMAMGPPRNTGALDAAFDTERTLIAEVLRRIFSDSHRPVPARRARRVADSLSRNSPTSGDSAYRAQLIGGLRRQRALVTRQLPTLHRPEVRRLAIGIAKAAKDRETMLTAGH